MGESRLRAPLAPSARAAPGDGRSSVGDEARALSGASRGDAVVRALAEGTRPEASDCGAGVCDTFAVAAWVTRVSMVDMTDAEVKKLQDAVARVKGGDVAKHAAASLAAIKRRRNAKTRGEETKNVNVAGGEPYHTRYLP